MNPLRPVQGAQQQLPQQRCNHPHVPSAKSAQRMRPQQPSPLIDQHEQITVEKKQLQGEDPRGAELFQSHAERGKTGAGDQNQGGADSEEKTQQNRGEGNPAAADRQRPEVEERLPVEKWIENADKDGKGGNQQQVAQQETGGQIASDEERQRKKKKGEQGGNLVFAERDDGEDKNTGGHHFGPRVDAVQKGFPAGEGIEGAEVEKSSFEFRHCCFPCRSAWSLAAVVRHLFYLQRETARPAVSPIKIVPASVTAFPPGNLPE